MDDARVPVEVALIGSPEREVPWAHYTDDGRAHLLVDHLREVSALAARFGGKIASERAAGLAGLWHDLGKYSGDFQSMIRRENGVEAHIEVEGGPRDHSSAGASYAIERLGDAGAPIAFVIAGHHAGLANVQDLKQRLKDKASQLTGVKAQSPHLEVMNAGLEGWRPTHLASSTDKLDLELWIRLLFSALCDADFLDTEAFYRPEHAARRRRPTDLDALREQLRVHLDGKSNTDTEVNRVRAEVRSACVAAATQPPGIFSLTVPTGGGKTLASMAFALEHATKHGLDRVIVAIPFTSILEQNAGEYRKVFGTEAVVEHHSGLDPEKEDHRNRISSENWDAPIVVTTTVQLFESLLASKPRQCRKLHNLARSVIVLDEAQSLPGELLPVILDILTRLCATYGSSLVISTATQPALGRTGRLPEGFASVTEICPPELRLFERLRRVHVRWPEHQDGVPYEQIAIEIAGERRALGVVHRRKDAADLCALIDAQLGDHSTHHLSALMTPAHRRETLSRIRDALQGSGPVRLVSTQLIEAGVDVDFPVVYRAFAGLDSLAQAAGRCNREGRLDSLGELRVFFAQTKPPPGVLQRAADVARTMWRADPALDLFASATHAQFFAHLYESMDLSRGRDLQQKRKEFQFRTVDRGDDTVKGFEMITNNWAAPLVIAHTARACALVNELEARGPSRDLSRKLQQFVINVPKKLLTGWTRAGQVRLVAEAIVVLDGPGAAAAYDSRLGLVLERVGLVDPAFLVQ